MTPLSAAIYRETFGQGTSDLAPGESAAVLFMLALFFGMILAALALIWLAKRERDRRLPSETQDLLEELRDRPDPARTGPSQESAKEHRDPWERDPEWWRS